jgi:hypothetical protein
VRSVVLAVVAAAGCIDTPPLAEPVIESSHVEIREVPEGRPPQLDVLIVLDDTAALSPYQDRVAVMSSAIAHQLSSISRGWLDLRVAVTGNDGLLRRLPGAAEPFLASARDLELVHHQNFDGSLEDALASLMTSAAASDGPGQPLEAMRTALERSSQFLREPAPFSLLVVSGADDASPWPIADYTQWMKSLTRGQWWRPLAAAGIYPQPAERLDAFFGSLWGWSITSAIDSSTFARPISALGEAGAWGEWGEPCLGMVPADRDPSTPELEPDCTMSIDIGGELRVLPECATPAAPTDRLDAPSALEPTTACWTLQTDAQSCFYESTLVLKLNGYTDFIHPAYRFECRTR